jgi:capsular exopolysaccharide synthesis family protein
MRYETSVPAVASRLAVGPVTAPEAREPSGAEFIAFGDATAAFWRRKWLVAGLATLCAGIGLAVAFAQEPVYQAKALIEIQGVNENFLNRREVDPSAEGGAVEFEPYIQTQIKILQTERLLGRVADRLRLDRLPEFQPTVSLADRARALLHVGGGRTSLDPRSGMLAAMAERLTVRLSGETRIIEVGFESNDPRTAAAVANALAEEYIAGNLEKRLSATQFTAKWLSGQLDELKRNLDEAERQLERYLVSHDLLYPSDAGKDSVAEARLRQLQEALSKAQEARIAEQSRAELIAKLPVENLSDAMDNETIHSYQAKLTDLRQKYAESRAVYTAEHYKVRQIQGQIDEVQGALERERRALLSRLRGGFESAQRRENLIQADLRAQTGLVREQSARAVEYDTLRRSVETYRKLYDSTLERVKETELASAIRANNVQVAEAAQRPTAPVRPSQPAYMAVGMFAGLLVGAVVALHRDRGNRLVRQPGEVMSRLGIAEFGPIPSAAIDLPFSVKGRLAGLTRTLPYRRAQTAPEDENELLRNWLETVTWRQRESALAEAYRGALASLMHSDGGEPPRVVVFTSACAGEGKTTTASNLGIALAESGRRVLLIDADRPRPHLHEIFKRSNDYGFGDYLLETAPVQELDLARLTTPTQIPNLDILPAGSDRVCLANLVENGRAARLLAVARRQYDAILIDTPPMMALSDARALGRMADGVALVIRAERTPEQMVIAASDRLRQDGTRVLGTILNSWTPARNSSAAAYRKAGYGYMTAGRRGE